MGRALRNFDFGCLMMYFSHTSEDHTTKDDTQDDTNRYFEHGFTMHKMQFILLLSARTDEDSQHSNMQSKCNFNQ